MTTFYPILKREMKSYFASPLAYIVIVVFQVISATFFFLYLKGFLNFQLDPAYSLNVGEFNMNSLVLVPYFETIRLVLLLVIPLITMRLIADERRNYTAELLFTAPISVRSVVIGKFVAALFLLAIMLALSAINIMILMFHGSPDSGLIISGYLGLMLLGATFLSIGMFASSLTDNQLIAAVLSLGILLLLWLIGSLSVSSGSLLGYVSVINHFDSFGKGYLDLKDLIYYLSLIYLGLYLSYTAIDSERWR